MLDETMVVLVHEFGRTPDMNSAGGRDHWGNSFTNLFIGGGVKPGRVIGKTDETAPSSSIWAGNTKNNR